MAEWRPLHQQLSFRSGLETGGQAFDPPLLPYEKSLIEAIGCTEEEYKTLVRHAMLRQRVRPAEYDHIPDVVASGIDPVTVLVINLVVGALLTTASVLLAPKPPSFESGNQKKITGRRLADQVGPSRYNQSSSFDNAPSLAELNTPIPIPFGRRSFVGGVRSGGLSLVPALVWSRVYAYGGYQAFEGVYVVGQAGIFQTPDKHGILLGTTALSALGDRDYAFYWSSGFGSNRPRTLLHGSEGSYDSGTVGRPVFTAPVSNEEFSPNFSMSYVPSGDTTFGTSTPIHNGTVYKFNWEVISAPKTAVENNQTAKFDIRAKRRKIAGTGADFLHDPNYPAFTGMPGEGRAYSRRMGFIYVNGTEYSTKTDVVVSVGNRAVFEIHKNDYSWGDLERTSFQDGSGFGGTEVNLDDLKNSAKGWRQRASDLLTVGTRWICGGVIWIVYDRREDPTVIHVYMECVAQVGGNVLGVPGTDTLRQALGGYEGQESLKNPEKFIENWYFNLCRLNVATIRPVRRNADTIELGIRSQVWNRASGLCNFNEVPSPGKLLQLDNQDINLSTGRMDKYFLRSSCFNVWVRRVADQGQPEEEFRQIKQLFCVQGSAPITQNNFLRIHPRIKGYYEYRLIPRTGSDIVANGNENDPVIVLQSSEGVPYAKGQPGKITVYPDSDGYGIFDITTQGRNTITLDDGSVKNLQVEDILHNYEFYTAPPSDISVVTTEQQRVVSSIAGVSQTTNTGNEMLKPHAFITHWLGDPRQSQSHKSIDFTVTSKPGKTITVRLSATAEQTATREHAEHATAATADSGWIWTAVGMHYVSHTGKWDDQEQFTITGNMNGKTLTSSSFVASETSGHYNVYALYADQKGNGYQVITTTYAVQTVLQDVQTQTGIQYGAGEGRIMETNSQAADCSYYEQVQKSNDSGPEHEVSYVNEYIVNETLAKYDDMTTVGFTVKSSGEISGVEQLRINTPDGISVTRLRFGLRPVRAIKTASNNFADLVYYLLTDKKQGVGSTVPEELIDVTSLETTADFLYNNQIFFDGVLEDSESFRSFLYDTAPLLLCTFTIKNGKFGMQPAVPFFKTAMRDSSDNIYTYVGGKINATTPLKIDQIFTAGNIIEDTLELQYIDISQRTNIRAAVTWRVTDQNDLPYQASALVHWADLQNADSTEQSFDLSEFCTNRRQALMTAKFLMSTRRRITKTISFKTTPEQLTIEPGSYIRVMTEASVYNADANGKIGDAGNVTSFVDIEDGTYDALLYGSADQEVIEAEITITNNIVEDSRFYGYLFSLLTRETDYSAYQIDSLNLDENGLVAVTAVEVPTDENGHSIIAKDVLDVSDDIFTVIS